MTMTSRVRGEKREGTFVRKGKEKQVFLLHFAHLFVPLHPKLEKA